MKTNKTSEGLRKGRSVEEYLTHCRKNKLTSKRYIQYHKDSGLIQEGYKTIENSHRHLTKVRPATEKEKLEFDMRLVKLGKSPTTNKARNFIEDILDKNEAE